MAEIIGLVASGMTIAGLFKTCVEAFDLIQTYRHQELDLKKLTLRLNIEKCRLYTWGQAMGLTETISQNQQRPLDLCQFQDLVTETLEIIFQLFNDTHKIKETYGCRPFSWRFSITPGGDKGDRRGQEPCGIICKFQDW
jgi:hypothetical protein